LRKGATTQERASMERRMKARIGRIMGKNNPNFSVRKWTEGNFSAGSLKIFLTGFERFKKRGGVSE
jgi:hypothetical protein